MLFLSIGWAHTLSLHVLPASCMEHVTTWKSTHELMMLERRLAYGALVIVSNIPRDIVLRMEIYG